MSGAGLSNTAPVVGAALPITTGGVIPAPAAVVFVTALSFSIAPDDGGVKVTATGTFNIGEGVQVRVQDGAGLDELCYSGVVGNGPNAESEDGTTLNFVLPPLPIGGPYNLVFTQAGGGFQIVGSALTVIHRSFTANLFNLRSSSARPRNVGAYSIEDET
jgi:hypothetical protein